jgi:hypothetical protein
MSYGGAAHIVEAKNTSTPRAAYSAACQKKHPLFVGGESFRRMIWEKRPVGERIRLPQLGRWPEPQFDKKGITKARKDENAKESASERMLAVSPISLSCFRTFAIS